jgi:2-dehydropantoate 2-reductase
VGITRAVPETRQLLIQALQEIADLAQAQQVQLEPEIVAMTLARIDQMAPAVVPSMQRDIQDGRPSELEAQTGAVVRMGRQAGCPTPVFETIYASLLPQEMLAREELQLP